MGQKPKSLDIGVLVREFGAEWVFATHSAATTLQGLVGFRVYRGQGSGRKTLPPQVLKPLRLRVLEFDGSKALLFQTRPAF